MSRKKKKFYMSLSRKNNDQAWAYFECQNYNLLERSLTRNAKALLGACEFRLVRILVDDPQTWYLDINTGDNQWRTIMLNDPAADEKAKQFYIEPPEWEGMSDEQLLEQIAPMRLGASDAELREHLNKHAAGMDIDKFKEAFGITDVVSQPLQPHISDWTVNVPTDGTSLRNT
jgi:hypothetical protein